jgi:hypothetical protein
MNNGLKTNGLGENEWIKSFFVVSDFFDKKADVVNGHQTSCRRKYFGQEPAMTEIPKNGYSAVIWTSQITFKFCRHGVLRARN